MRNAFNLLLVTLACFDSSYVSIVLERKYQAFTQVNTILVFFQLFGSILESFRKEFKLVTDVHILLFPYLLWPFTQIVFTCSIFMTVAIAVERFIAVHYPINYSQAMHEANALTKRIVKYVSAVTFLSIVFTITRFFEAKIVYESETDPMTNVTYQRPVLHPTELRTAPLYTAYFNWSRLIVLGIIPFVLLVYLNTMIYKVSLSNNDTMNGLQISEYGAKSAFFYLLFNKGHQGQASPSNGGQRPTYAGLCAR